MKTEAVGLTETVAKSERSWSHIQGEGNPNKEAGKNRICSVFQGCTKMFTYSDCKKCSKQPTSTLQVQEFESGNASNLALLLVAVTVVRNSPLIETQDVLSNRHVPVIFKYKFRPKMG